MHAAPRLNYAEMHRMLNVRTYKVEFETDRETGDIVVSIPTLNYTADFGRTVEEALRNLQRLASGFVRCLAHEGERLPPSDRPGEGVFISLRVPRSLASTR